MLEASPPILPNPAVGTRLSFRLVYPEESDYDDYEDYDNRSRSRSRSWSRSRSRSRSYSRSRSRSPRGRRRARAAAAASFQRTRQKFITKDLGSVVLGGAKGPGAGYADKIVEDDEMGLDSSLANGDDYENEGDSKCNEDDQASLTLEEARFIPGDYISCAILPPDELTGEVMPAGAAKVGRGAGVGEATTSWGEDELPSPPLPPASSRYRDRERDYHWSGGGGYNGRGRGWRGRRGRRYSGDFGRGGLPEGEWRRGDVPNDDGDYGRWR